MIAQLSEQKSQIEKDSFSLQKDNFSSPIVTHYNAKRASLHSKCCRLELKEALSGDFEEILWLSKPTNTAVEISRIDFLFVTIIYCMCDICILYLLF